jgi:hypothetical protein
MGAILQRSVGKHPQGIRLGNSHDHSMKECQVSHSIWRELNKWLSTNILGNYLVFKREPRNKWMCMEAHWKVFGVWSREKLASKEIRSKTPSSRCFTHGCAKGFWGEWERQR